MKLTVSSSQKLSQVDWFVPIPSGDAVTSLGPEKFSVKGLRVPSALGERVFVPHQGSAEARVWVVSMGDRTSIDGERLRSLGGMLISFMIGDKLTRAVVDVRAIESLQLDGACDSFCEGLNLGVFRFDRHLSKKTRAGSCRITLFTTPRSTSITRAQRRAAIVSDGVNWARELGHEPANVINPVTLATQSRNLATTHNLRCTVIDERQMKRLKMGAFLGVGQGSATPPRLIVLEYGSSKGARPVVLVGKAVTFDTGGYSLKDKQSMVGMKYDKCGGTAVLGVMKAVAKLKPKVPVIGLVAAAENMISAQAYRPNDILTSMSGKTVEIISTDAEGRLVLADALTYAQWKYKPRAIIDLATLTGGIVVALGKARAGLFCNDDKLAGRLLESGERTRERLWRLPIDDDYFEMIRGDDSDMKNSAGREAHAILGAMFLKQFVDKNMPWAHLDIAGVAAIDKPLPYCPVGATGFGVRLVCDYLERL